MPNNNTVTIQLNAKDAASGVINNLNKSLEGATFRAQLLSQTLFAGVSAGLSALNSKFKEAADLQLNNITAASTYAALTGRSFKDSEQVFAVLDARLNKIAAALPGSTQAYKDLALGIQDNLVPAFVDANGVLNEGAFLDGLTEITRGMGFLAAASNVASKDVSKFTAQFLGGASKGQLQQLLFHEKNPAFLALVDKKLAESGKRLEQLTVKERAEILKAVQAQLVTPETINAASNSVSGLLESLKDKLFNPSQGVFGLLRDLDEKTKDNQSVLSAFNDTLKALIGNDGLFAAIGKTLSLLGIKDTAFLDALRGGILNFTEQVSKLDAFFTGVNLEAELTGKSPANILFEKIREGIANIDFKSIGGSLSNFFKNTNFKGIGSSLSGIINPLISGLGSIDYAAIFSSIGQAASEFLKGFKIDGSKLTGLLDKLIEGINSIDWSALFQVIGVVLALITNILAQVLTKLDWGKILNGLLDGLGIFLAALDWGAIAKIAGAILLGAFAVGLAGLAATLLGVPTLVIGGIVALVVGLIAVIKVKWKDITEAFNNFWNFIVEGFENLKKDAVTVWNRTISTVLGFFNAVQQYFTDLISKIPGLNQTPNTANSGLSSGIAAGAEAAIPNAASGMSNGLLAALVRERRNAPPGSGLVVANTSEAILTRQQQANLLNNFGGRGGLNIGNITIYTQATDAESIARDIGNFLTREYEKYSQTHFSTATT
ncbi:hypothetical protein H6G04_27135 [Calothrix membranacea FACHB-236]|nr:hypothetical protein [Calothrix membranacea FACHB-236]